MVAPAPARPTAPPSNPPPQRRRRAALRTLRGDWRRMRPGTATGLLVLVCLSLMLFDVRGGPTDTLRAAGAWLGGPLESAASSLFGPAATQTLRRPDAASLEDRITELERQNTELRLRNDQLADELAAAPGAAAVQRYARSLGADVVTARIVAAESGPLVQAVTVDRGAHDGVAPDSAVVVPAGVVGRVVEVGATTSTVQLVVDPASAVAGRLRGSRQVALAHGTGSGLALAHLDALAQVAPGEVVVTMGSPGDRPFPPGLPVGTVTAVHGGVGDVDRAVDVAPVADLGTLEHVAILPGVTP